MLKELTVVIPNELPLRGWNVDADLPKGRYLYLSHPFDTKMVYGLNIGAGSLILATNASRELISLELGIPRRFWKLAAPELQRPQPAIQGTLALPNFNARRQEYDDVEPAVYSDHSLSFVNILVDATYELGPLWAKICDKCFINVSDGYLVAFWIDLNATSQD